MSLPRAALALALLALAGCAREAPAPASYRTAGTPIASTTRGTADALAGNWQVAAAYPGPGPAVGAPVSISLTGSGAGELRWGNGSWALTQVAPGRWDTPAGPLWLLWADETFRVAVLGTPGGSFGFVLTRPELGQRPDLMNAAREMLDFNGYDLAALQG
ncbi:lipocalin family protein [Pseudoroseicyclus sp. H15]